jgi:hypothetical protein
MRNDKVPSSVETLVWIDGEGYSYSQLQEAVRYVGRDFKYIGAPGIPSEVRVKLGNIDLPRGEAGDDYTDLKERVAIIEQSYLMRIEAIEADAKSEREYVRGTFRVLEEWLTKFHNRLAKF